MNNYTKELRSDIRDSSLIYVEQAFDKEHTQREENIWKFLEKRGIGDSLLKSAQSLYRKQKIVLDNNEYRETGMYRVTTK